MERSGDMAPVKMGQPAAGGCAVGVVLGAELVPEVSFLVQHDEQVEDDSDADRLGEQRRRLEQDGRA
jgi:hypothetical protein